MLFFSRKKGIPKVGEIVKVSKSKDGFHCFDNCFGQVVGYRGEYVTVLSENPYTGNKMKQAVPYEDISKINFLDKIKNVYS